MSEERVPQPENSQLDTMLQKLISVTEKTEQVPRSPLDRYFWVFVLIGLIGVPIVTIALAWGLSILRGNVARSSALTVFETSEVRVTGPTELCPGESLNFEFDVVVKEVGTYNLWMSTWKVDPPPSTIIFSETEPFVVGSLREFPITRGWIVPDTYIDRGDNVEKQFTPGKYTRDISITAEGRDTLNTPLVAEFNIRKGCKR